MTLNRDINIGAITEVLNDKADKRDFVEAYPVIQTYSNGSSWYRIYSDGWCEQGGIITGTSSGTLSFLKIFANTSYVIIMHGVGTYSSSVSGNGLFNPKTRTTSNCTYYQDSNVTEIMWQASGYLAEGEY